MDVRAGCWLLIATLALASCGGLPEGTCQSNRDCTGNATCISGKCEAIAPRRGCSMDEMCAADQYCDIVDRTCKARTSPDASAADGTVTSPDASGSDDDSGDGGLPPADDASVPSGDAMGGADASAAMDASVATDAAPAPDGGSPMSCGMDNDCMPGPPQQVCRMNRCALGCTVDTTACTAAEICNTNTGHCVARPTTCARDSECAPPMRVCEGTQCVPGCGQPAGLQCSGNTPICNMTTGRCDPRPPCTIDADCGNPALRCDAPACVTRCDRPGGAACTGTMVCSPESGRCVAGGLAIGAMCSFDAQCTTGMCLGITRMGTTTRVCASACGATSNCPLNFSCVNLNGMGFCLGEALFPGAAFDVAAGGACTSASNMCQSTWCNTGSNQCIETCSRSSDCGTRFGNNCWTYAQTLMGQQVYDHLCLTQSGGVKGALCTANAGCRSGICNRYRSTCAAHCCRDADCAAAESCVVYDLDTTTGEIVKICAPRSTMAGTGALGATCTTAADCESEVCAPLVPTSSTSARKCSTTCCTNGDCGSLPAGGRCRPFPGPTVNMIPTIVGVCVPN